MKTIIVPTDYSPIAGNAIEYAIALANDTGCGILLFHAYQVPVSMTDVPIALVSVDDLQKNETTRMKEAESTLVNATGNIATETKLGNTVDELQSLCDRVQPFAVVMGTKGETAIERAFFGSTTLSTIRHLSWPVIVVPPGKKYSPIKKIGFACDLKEVTQSTPTHFIKDFVRQFHAELHVLNVDHKNSKRQLEATKELTLLRSMFQDLNPQFDFIDDESVEAGIERFAEANNLDLVITIPKKHKLFDSLFRKSHTKDLIFHSRLPIMCVHE